MAGDCYPNFVIQPELSTLVKRSVNHIAVVDRNIDRRGFIGHAVAKLLERIMIVNRRTFVCATTGLLAWGAFAHAGETRIFEIALQGGKIVDAETTIKVTEGDKVELHWSSDGKIELHLHGYDIEIEIEAGDTGIMTFEAYATGRFPIVAHGHGASHAPFAYLEVHPD
jgi:predicted ester cyclase